jgi:hypothetical protein
MMNPSVSKQITMMKRRNRNEKCSYYWQEKLVQQVAAGNEKKLSIVFDDSARNSVHHYLQIYSNVWTDHCF